MKAISRIVLVIYIIAASSCMDSGKEEARLRTENLKLKQELDSLRHAVNIPPDTAVADTLKDIPAAPDPAGLEGRHAFTLQWISWDEPGSVMIRQSGDGWYSIEGGQKSRTNSDHITITGRIKKVSTTELLFEGEITSVVANNNGGKPCIKTGTQTFKATGKRKYWRMQDMINCEGGMLTDYVDIYF